jgi:hypothetical protein
MSQRHRFFLKQGNAVTETLSGSREKNEKRSGRVWDLREGLRRQLGQGSEQCRQTVNGENPAAYYSRKPDRQALTFLLHSMDVLCAWRARPKEENRKGEQKQQWAIFYFLSGWFRGHFRGVRIAHRFDV